MATKNTGISVQTRSQIVNKIEEDSIDELFRNTLQLFNEEAQKNHTSITKRDIEVIKTLYTMYKQEAEHISDTSYDTATTNLYDKIRNTYEDDIKMRELLTKIGNIQTVVDECIKYN